MSKDTKIFWGNGLLRLSRGYNKHGEIEGIQREFRFTGRIIFALFYENGKRKGMRMRFDNNGLLSETSYFEKDNKEGISCGYNKYGIISYLDIYRKGKCVASTANIFKNESKDYVYTT
jgi:antitoxin component YwqK of YwqJK toxin-antitoxin module